MNSSHTPRFGANPLASSERTQLKEGASAFFDRLAEVEKLCLDNPLNRQDPDMRDRVGKEVEEIVITGYRPLWAKAQGKGLEKCERKRWFKWLVMLMSMVQILRAPLMRLAGGSSRCFGDSTSNDVRHCSVDTMRSKTSSRAARPA